MSRREESKRERQRAEEDALDKQLKDAGLYENGMSYEEKQMMLQMLEESKKLAEQEEDRRQQLRHDEEQAITQSLNESLDNEEGSPSKDGEANAHVGSEDSSGDSDVVAIIPGSDAGLGKGGSHPTRSGSNTPELIPLGSGSSRSLPSTHAPSPSPQVSSFSADEMIDSQRKREERQSPQNQIEEESDDDFICDSQTSQKSLSSTPRNTYAQSPKADNTDCSLILQKSGNTLINSKRKLDRPLLGFSPGGRKKTFKRFTSEGLQSQNAHCEDERKSDQLSEPLLSSIIDKEGNDLISPLVGQRKVFNGHNKNNVKNQRDIQEAQISNSSPVIPVQQVMDSDEESVDESEKLLDSVLNINQGGHQVVEAQSTTVAIGPPGELKELVQEDVEQILEENVTKKHFVTPQKDSHEVLFSSAEKSSQSSSKIVDIDILCKNINVSDSEEELSFNFKNDRKRNINVFFTQDLCEIPLKRRKSDREEDRAKVYFRENGESVKECSTRILKMISNAMEKVVIHQKGHPIKKRWSSPLAVDKRIKDSLDRPQTQARRQLATSVTRSVNESNPPRRMTRAATNTPEPYLEDTQGSGDSLPEIISKDDGWIDGRKKRANKRRDPQLGVGNKRQKLTTLLEASEESLSHTENLKQMTLDSDEDDYEIFPLKKTVRTHTYRHHVVRKFSSPKENFKRSVVDSSANGLAESSNKLGCDVDDDSTDMQVCSKSCEDKEETSRKEPNAFCAETLPSCSTSKTPLTTPLTGMTSITRRRLLGRPQTKNLRLTNDADDDNPSKDQATAPSVNFQLEVMDFASSGSSCSPSRSTTLQPDEKIDQETKESRIVFGSGRRKNEKEDNLGKKSNLIDYVSSSRLGSDDELAEANRRDSIDVCIVNSDSGDGTESKCFRGPSPDCDPSKPDNISQLHIRPGPVKLKKKPGKGRGNGNTLRSQKITVHDGAEISSSVDMPSQQFVNETQPDCSQAEDKEEETSDMMPCPLCQKLFPMELIQQHASDCCGSVEETSQPQAGRRRGNGKRRGNPKAKESAKTEVMEVSPEVTAVSSATSERKSRTVAKNIRCSYCQRVYLEGDDYLLHVRSCEAKERIEESIMSPSTSRISDSVTPRPKLGMRGGDVGSTRETSVKSGSLFETLEGDPMLIHGDITDSEFCSPHVALVQILNCIAVKPHGLSETLAKVYPYSDLYTTRKAMGSMNRAVLEDRPDPGTISVCRHPSDLKKPVIVNIYGQFYMGKEFSSNFVSRKMFRQGSQNTNSTDDHFLKGLQNDTCANRIEWFRKGLNDLARRVSSEKIKQVVFPCRIGSGLAGGNWEIDYLPAIRDFRNAVNKCRIKVTIVDKVERTPSDQVIAIQGTKKSVSSKWNMRK